MRNVLWAASIIVLFFSCSQEQKTDTLVHVSEINVENTPAAIASIKFVEEEYDFGIIDEGDIVSHTFNFTNDGEVDLLITDAKASCGCTVPQYPRKPIAPGEQGKINVRFDSSHKPGMQRKTISIFANIEYHTVVLKIKSQVISRLKKGLGPLKETI